MLYIRYHTYSILFIIIITVVGIIFIVTFFLRIVKDVLGPVLPIVVLYAIFIHSYSSTTKLSSIFLNHDFLVGKSHLIFSLIRYPVICFNLNGSLCNISTSTFNFQAEALHECRELRQTTNKNTSKVFLGGIITATMFILAQTTAVHYFLDVSWQ